MPALTAANVTATVDKSTRRIGPRGLRTHLVTLSFGDGALTYPANGVPLPTGQAMGLPRGSIENIDIYDTGASLAMINYDKVHNTLRFIHPTGGANPSDGVEYLTSFAPLATTIKAQIQGF